MRAACNKFASIMLLTWLLSGCSWHYVDSAGNEKILGLSIITLAQHKCTLSATVTSAGFTLDTTHDSGGLNLGYKTVSSVYFNHDVSGSSDDTSLQLLFIKNSNGAGFIESNCRALSPAAQKEMSHNGEPSRS